MSRWFEADKVGLRQIAERLVERRGFGIIGAELYQNVMDTNATVCEIVLEKTKTRGWYALVCEDNDPVANHLDHGPLHSNLGKGEQASRDKSDVCDGRIGNQAFKVLLNDRNAGCIDNSDHGKDDGRGSPFRDAERH